MNQPELKHKKNVKEITLGEDCIYIDLIGGLRLSGPMAPVAQNAKQPERKPRRMIVSGHEAIYDEALALG